jgi:hypothetical protein
MQIESDEIPKPFPPAPPIPEMPERFQTCEYNYPLRHMERKYR